MFDITSFDFWIGFAGGAFITAAIAELIKNIIFEFTKKEMKTIWKTVLALPIALPVAYVFHRYLNAGNPTNWDTVPAMALIYWGTSGIWYNLIIKKLGEMARSNRGDHE